MTNLMHRFLFFNHKYYSLLHISSIKCSSSGGNSRIYAVYENALSVRVPGCQSKEFSLSLCIDWPPGTLIESAVPYSAYIGLFPPEKKHLILEKCRGK